MEVEGQGYRWFNRPPTPSLATRQRAQRKHVVILEMDGSITVHASIENASTAPTRSAARPDRYLVAAWHGHLERGVWRES